MSTMESDRGDMLPVLVEQEHAALNFFMEQVIKEIVCVQAEREEAYRRAMEPQPREESDE